MNYKAIEIRHRASDASLAAAARWKFGLGIVDDIGRVLGMVDGDTVESVTLVDDESMAEGELNIRLVRKG
jgi:hypothetical protein